MISVGGRLGYEDAGNTPNSNTHAKAAVADMQRAWRAAGVDPARRVVTAFSGGAVAKDGEPLDSARIKAQAGPHATIALHNLVEVEEFGNMGRGVPPQLAPLLERYREIYRTYDPPDARYLSNHRGHLMVLRPEEHEVCTADLIRTVTLSGTKSELRERIRELDAPGYTHLSVHIRHGHPEMLEEWAERKGVAKRFRAEVPLVNGLGLYFWLRLGYRPPTPGHTPSPAPVGS